MRNRVINRVNFVACMPQDTAVLLGVMVWGDLHRYRQRRIKRLTKQLKRPFDNIMRPHDDTAGRCV